MILILSQTSDPTTDMVTDALAKRGAEFVRFDTAKFPQTAKLTAYPNSLEAPGLLVVDDREIWLRDIRVVYRRHPAAFELADSLTAAERRFAMLESVAGMGGTFVAQPWRWIDHPSAVADASYKPTQLRRAMECGFEVPASIVTNDAEQVRNFARKVGGNIVYKSLSSGVVTEAGNVGIIYTTRTTADQLDDRAIASTCNLFQEWVPKKFDVRMTVVGNEVFAVAVHAHSDATHVDWRTHYDHLAYDVIENIPFNVRFAAISYLALADLTYGAFDFSVTADGTWWFLECNPSGQWGWIADETGLPIADAIASEMFR